VVLEGHLEGTCVCVGGEGVYNRGMIPLLVLL
jgi:hypothetical protein